MGGDDKMDEELMDILTEENIDVADIEIVESEVGVEDVEQNIETEETMETVEVEDAEEITIEMDEAIGWVGGDSTKHYSLAGRDEDNQHPISAITGLRAELDKIESLKTVYSDKIGVSNYYAWNEGAYDEHGYFVSLVPHTTTIKICEDTDIFGVTVDAAGFVGNQDTTVPRDNSYGLVATSGLVDVRCESTVAEGDYVVSNAHGVAEKTTSGCGYKVIAIENKNGVNYAAISLGVQACTTDLMGKNLQRLDERMGDAETNIVAAMNVANQAYNKANDCISLNGEIGDQVSDALDRVDDMEADVENMVTQVGNLATISAQAKAIAESAATSAESMRNEAVEKSKEALVSTVELREEFATMEEGVKELDDRVTIIQKNTSEQGVAIAGIQVKANEQASTIDSLTSWQSDTKTAMARIEQKADANGAYIQSTVANLDKYSVGPYSQAYGFTLEQARSVLEEGMVYVPTPHEDKDTHDEVYTYTETDVNGKEVVKNYPDDDGYQFTPGYIYTWSDIGTFGDTKTMMWKESVGEVVEFASAPSGDAFDFWYTNSDEVEDGYEPYTLYKYGTYDTVDDDGNATTESRWEPVAMLKGNSQNRAVSQIRQDANRIAFEVTHPDGSFAGMRAELDKTSAKVDSVAAWPSDVGTDKYNMAILKQHSDGNTAHLALAAIRNVGKDVYGNNTFGVDELGGAKIVLSDTANGGSFIQMDADKINFTTDDYSVLAKNIDLTGNITFSSVQSQVNNAIASTVVEYALSKYSDNFEPIESEVGYGEWNTQAPPWQDGAYMWQRTIVTYVDSTKLNTVTTTCIQGAKGETGSVGTSITGVAMQYHLSTSNTTAPSKSSTSWVPDPTKLDWSASNYIWCREKISYSNNTTSYTDARVDDALSVVSSWCYEGNKTSINGACIATGTIAASQITTGTLGSYEYEYTDGETYSTKGTLFNLDTGELRSKSFAIDANGAATFSGELNAATGTFSGELKVGTLLNISVPNYSVKIGGFDVGDNHISCNKASYNDSNNGVYLGTTGIGLGRGNFYVSSDGYFVANNGKIGGWEIGRASILKNYSGMYSGSDSMDSLVIGGSQSAIRFRAGSKYDNYETMSVLLEYDPGSYRYEAEVNVGADKDIVHCAVSADVQYEDERKNSWASYNKESGIIYVSWEANNFDAYGDSMTASLRIYYLSSPLFAVLEDGSLYATASNIGGWSIKNNSMFLSDSNGYKLAEIANGYIAFYDKTEHTESLKLTPDGVKTPSTTVGWTELREVIDLYWAGQLS